MKTAIVTGAARGIGLATAKRFLDQGWRVAMVDRDEPALREEAGRLGNVEQVAAMAAHLAGTCDSIDALVNNAGVADFGPIAETGFARWRRVMETDLDGGFEATGIGLPALRGG